jgi:hypothetical protein
MTMRRMIIRKSALWLVFCRSMLSLLIAIAGFSIASSALGDLLSGDALSNSLASRSTSGELARLSSASLKKSDWHTRRLRQWIDAPRAERVFRAITSGLRSDDRFSLGRKINDPLTLQIPTKRLHEKTIGRIRTKSFNKYSTFDDYWQAGGTGSRGKFFESQSVLQANSALKKQGSAYRYAITAVEGDPGHPADLVLLNDKGKIVRRCQLKSTRNVNDIIKFSQEAKYSDMTLVTHPETLMDLSERGKREIEKARLRGQPPPTKWQNVLDKLERGLITDELVDGKKVHTLEKTAEGARKFRLFQWLRGPDAPKIAKGVSGTVRKTLVVPKTLAMLSISAVKVAKSTLVVLEVVAAPVDLGFAAYGYYDTFSRYNREGLDQDIFATKLAIHTTEAALGGAAVYSLGVGLGLIAAPEPVVSKVTGIVVVVGSVVVLAADIAVSSVIANRDQARERTLEVLTSSERRLAIHAELQKRLRAVVGVASTGV